MRDSFAVKGQTRGRCSICGVDDELTFDHVPPKGAARIGAMAMRSLGDRIGAPAPMARFRRAADGVKFRSICAACNNSRLGVGADPELARLCNGAHDAYFSVTRGVTFGISARPMRILRAICGHLLATVPGRSPVGTFEQGMQVFFMDTSSIPPTELECFYWPYPYNDQVIIRDVTMKRLGVGNAMSFKLLKFYPLAFLLTWERETDNFQFQMRNLNAFHTLSNDDEALITVALPGMPRQRWPEMPVKGDDYLTLWAEKAATHAEPRTKKPS